MTTHTPCARDIWWTLDFASAFLPPGVNSRTELVPSPRAYARNGAPRRWLGNNATCVLSDIKSLHVIYYGWHDLPQGLWIINEYFKYYLKHEQKWFMRYKDTRRCRVSLGPIKRALRMFWIASKTIDLVSSLAK
jgi:hypothetical protein